MRQQKQQQPQTPAGFDETGGTDLLVKFTGSLTAILSPPHSCLVLIMTLG